MEKGITIKELAKKQNMSYHEVYNIIRRFNKAGIIKPCGRKGRETLWELSNLTRDHFRKEGII